MATTAYSVIHHLEYEDQFDEAVSALRTARNASGDPALRQVLAVVALEKIDTYLSNFDPVGVSSYLKLGAIYKIMGDDSFFE